MIAVAIILALDLLEQETDRALAEARRRELLARERERIGRDLHDGIIQSIYAAGLDLEEAAASLDPPTSRARGSGPCWMSSSESAATSATTSTCARQPGDARRGGDRAGRGG